MDAAASAPTGSWLLVGELGDIPLPGARTVRTAQGPIAVFRTSGGEVYALLDRCPHKGGPLSEGIVHGCRVACPLHGMYIDLASGRAVAPDEGEVARFPVRVEDGRVYLGLVRPPAGG